MVFWVLVGIVTFLAVGAFIYNVFQWGDVAEGVFFGFLFALVGSLLSVILVLGSTLLFRVQSVSPDTKELRALATSDSVSGRFFLGSGTVSGQNTFNYITQDDGYSTLRSARASSSRVFEGDTSPSVTEYTFRYDNPWVLPWTYTTGYSWDFHIPEGSILSNYEVKP